MSPPNCGSIHSPYSGATSSWSTRSSSRKDAGSACLSKSARANCCCVANARSSSAKNGPGSAPPWSGSVSHRRSCSRPQTAAPRNSQRRDAEAMAAIEAHGLRKAFGTTVALDSIDLRLEEGRILGIIGPNGAGKTTALNAVLGLTPYQGTLQVLGRNPWTQRDQL